MTMSGSPQLPGSLTISSVVEEGTASLSLEGELDLASARRMEEHLAELEDARPARLVVDLQRLAFIDSTGLRLLIQADARARERGGELVLRPGDASVQRVFEMTGALDVLSFEDAPGT
jgi:anti-sigma B factor antagonist